MTTQGPKFHHVGRSMHFRAGEVVGHANTKAQAGMKVLRCGGIGSLASLCGPEALACVLKDDGLLQTFLDLCECFDQEILPDGPGTRQRAGLIAVAEPMV